MREPARAVHIERRIASNLRPFIDAVAREPLTCLVQALIRACLPDLNIGLVEEQTIAGEDGLIDDIIANMSQYLHTHYEAGTAQCGGNTKTHGVRW